MGSALKAEQGPAVAVYINMEDRLRRVILEFQTAGRERKAKVITP